VLYDVFSLDLADSHLTKTLTVYSAELCIIHDERTVLNPRRVMRALSLYTNNFNLTRQQVWTSKCSTNASEAFLHLLSSLKNESYHNYVLHRYITGRQETSMNLRDGDKFFLVHLKAPLELLVDFESFHCLPLSPVLDRSENIIDGCTLMDCLKHFTAVEHLESYHCSRCWHIAVIKHLSLKSEKDE
ncbi:Ubiquitin carboxyl-terminal hydrolase 27, partial [Ananas comosus]